MKIAEQSQLRRWRSNFVCGIWAEYALSRIFTEGITAEDRYI
ncbi:MAG TPA: hypothetical protein VEH58_05340 [Dehalococcoidales bacterium]|nr:hypothetical protein [Dehalococcoidales bacterium]